MKPTVLDVNEALDVKMDTMRARAVELYGKEIVDKNDYIASDNAMYCAGALMFQTQKTFIECINCTDEKKDEALQTFIKACDDYADIYVMSLYASIADDLRDANNQ
tara:strand:- start:712 stop:1029 length:318 start_codon:yes stop_codon:yes gene_type:complete